MDKFKYRADIDGLRAVAVMLVVLYHAGFNGISGGFIGVDVFFVISGFLITSLIFREINNGSFKFSRFYERRILRLLPVFVVVLVITTIFAVIVLFPQNLISYVYSLTATFFAVANVYFWRNNGGYFRGSAQEEPLLHTWSLNVEEQFYFVWPILLLIGLKYLNKNQFIVACTALFLITTILSEWATNVTIGAAYYLLPTRFFQMLAGSLLALTWSNLPITNRFINNSLSIIGVLLLAYASTYLNSESSYPGLNALFPTVATLLLIYTGKNTHSSFVNHILSTKYFKGVGLISYSLYLWHWPIISFFLLFGYSLNLLTSTMIVLSSMGLATITYLTIERPFRYPKKRSFKKSLLTWYILPLIVTCIISASILISDGLPNRFDEKINRKLQAVYSLPDKNRDGCHKSNREYTIKPNLDCKFGDIENFSKVALLIGDSHANHYTGMLQVLAEKSGVKLIDFSMDACLPIFGMLLGRNKNFANYCGKHNRLTEAFIKENNFDYVIIAANWSGESGFKSSFQGPEVYNRQILKQAVSETFQTVVNAGSIPLIIHKMYPQGDPSPICSVKRQVYKTDLSCDVSLAEVESNGLYFKSVIEEIKNKMPLLEVFDPAKLLCSKNSCKSELNDVPLFRDQYHLNYLGSTELGLILDKNRKNPFKLY